MVSVEFQLDSPGGMAPQDRGSAIKHVRLPSLTVDLDEIQRLCPFQSGPDIIQSADRHRFTLVIIKVIDGVQVVAQTGVLQDGWVVTQPGLFFLGTQGPGPEVEPQGFLAGQSLQNRQVQAERLTAIDLAIWKALQQQARVFTLGRTYIQTGADSQLWQNLLN